MARNYHWRDPDSIRVDPFRIIGDIFFVGNKNVSSHLIETDDGLVLLDTTFGATAYLVVEAIERLGFILSDVKLLVGMHGHEDHVGGHAEMKKRTGAKTLLGKADVHTVEEGTEMTCAEYTYGIKDFRCFKVDRPLNDGDIIELGDKSLEVLHTPGHTPGTVSLTWKERDEDGRELTVTFFGGPGLWTIGHPTQGYPSGIGDFERSLLRLKELSPDVWLGAHPGQNDTFGKADRLKAGGKPNPFIDPEGWRRFLEDLTSSFHQKARDIERMIE